MRPQLIFAVKVIGLSILLSVVWGYVSAAYVWSVVGAESLLNPGYVVAGDNSSKMREMTMLLIPFVSFMLATPCMGYVRKAAVVVACTLVYWVADFMLLYWYALTTGHAAESQLFLAANATSFIVKGLVPFVLWMILGFPYMRDMFNWKTEFLGKHL